MGHVRRNVIAYLALFVALSGTGYAVSKIGARDIKRDAIRAKHVEERSVGRRIGSGVYFGQALDFGAVPSNVGSTKSVPLTGRETLDADAEGDVGAYPLLAPVALRFRDLRARTLSPVPRPVRLVVLRVGDPIDTPILSCRIPAGSASCLARGPSAVLRPNEVGSLAIEAPVASGGLPEQDYLYSVRIVPR